MGEKTGKRKRIFLWFLAFAALGVILGLTLQSANGTMALSDWCREVLLKILPKGSKMAKWVRQNIRRLGHIPEYFLLGLTVYSALKASFPEKKVFWPAIAVCAAVSVGDQSFKQLIPVRHFDIADLPMDFIGYSLGAALGWGIQKERE